jgi:UDP-glucose-4-epimerase GalE
VQWGPFVKGDICDHTELVDTIRRFEIAAVLHFAAFAYVGESIAWPERYFVNNVAGSLALFDALLETGVRHVVFSSSCAIYGTPDRIPITEDTTQCPINPYGESKLMIERALHWYGKAHPLRWTALRYFNAAGADPEGKLGELHSPETHLIPRAFEAASGGRPLEVFGDDYPTRDGTCVRDFIHVSDLADAHVRAVDYLMDGGKSMALNLGTGKGHTVSEVIRTVQTVTGRKVLYRVTRRRPGDPAELVADPRLAGEILGWHPKYSTLETIVGSAWKWHSEHARKFLI